MTANVDGRDETNLLAGMLAATGSTIDDEKVEGMRRALDRQGRVDRRLAAALVLANRRASSRCDAWVEFYLEALAAHFLSWRGDGFTLPLEKENMLLGWIGEAASIQDIAERRLLIRILLRCEDVSERFERRVLGLAATSLLTENRRFFGDGERRAGEIDAVDMGLIRRLTRRGGERRPLTAASREFLLNLDQQATKFSDNGAWRRLLAESMTLRDPACEAASATSRQNLGEAELSI